MRMVVESALVALGVGFGWNWVLLDFALQHPMFGPPPLRAVRGGYRRRIR